MPGSSRRALIVAPVLRKMHIQINAMEDSPVWPTSELGILAQNEIHCHTTIFSRVRKYRKEAKEGGTSVLYLNAGDTYTGTAWFTIFKDKIASAFLNKLEPDAIVCIFRCFLQKKKDQPLLLYVVTGQPRIR